MAGRLVIASNRLPVTVERADGRCAVRPSTGGLATGMRSVHAGADTVWIGYPGTVDAGAREGLTATLAADGLVPIWLDAAEVRGYYEGIANGVLWPLCHYLPERIPLQMADWGVYERVNDRFAAAIAARHRPGDVVWVHDYQLMLVPALLRARIPDARIGFFLHIPFPSSDLFRTLPFRERLLEGLLGADLIGFHTAAYARHFASSVLRLLGIGVQGDRLQVGASEVRIGVFPMGVDAARWAALGEEPEVVREAATLRGDDGCQLLVGIDRLDYTKGIPRRLLAFEALLRTHPELHERVRLLQLAVPSREYVTAYREYRGNVDALVGRINGAFGTTRWMPIHYLYRSLEEREVAALYRAADVMVVTPVRDGMNLVAKEFVAARGDESGVLVLSEFAGAAAELAEAILVNPYDIDGTGAALHRALAVPAPERRLRMQALRRRVVAYDVHRWARKFLDTLLDASAHRMATALAFTAAAELDRVVARLTAAPRLVLLLDYDGTLVPYAAVPELAIPDAPLLDLLGRLAARAGTQVHVVSGRSREVLDGWFGAVRIGLHAEHGMWSRPPGGEWTPNAVASFGWRERARAVLEEFRERTPGSLVEEKSAALAWHYRMAEPEFGARQANDLRMHLVELFSNEPLQVIVGEKVIELRPQGVHKGQVVGAALRQAPAGALVVALGDDRTDEDLFAALPAGGIAVHVGPAASRAAIRVTDWTAARRLLDRIAEERGATESAA